MKRAFGYLRVSGKGQLAGDGFDRQRETINAFCEVKGYAIVRWFEEKAVSGTVDAMDRPAFSEMMGMATEANGVEAIIVERADRLARDLMVSEMLIEEARKTGVQVFDAAGDIDLTNCDDPSRVMIRQLMGVLAQWEKNNLVKKLKAARDRKSREMGRCCNARIPWEMRPEGFDLGRAIFEMRERGARFQEIANWLNVQKIPAPKGGNYWHRTSVHDIYVRVSASASHIVRNPVLHNVLGGVS